MKKILQFRPLHFGVSSCMMKRAIESLKGKQWYHQRFDGSPLYLDFIAEAEIKKEPRKPVGTEANTIVCFFKDHKADWYISMDDIAKGSETMIRLARKNSRVSAMLLHAWARDEKKFQDFFNVFDRIPLHTLSDKGLVALYRKYHRLTINRFTSSAIIDHFALGTDEYIARMLRKEVGVVGRESEFTDIFSIATAPVHQSFINESEMELLKIALDASHNKEKIAHYQKKYFWITNNYVTSQVLSMSYFQKEIGIWRKFGANLNAKYQQLKNAPQMNAKKKAVLFKKYRFSRLLRTLLTVSEDFTKWQDERKRATYLNIHMGSKMLAEMASRRGHDPELAKYLTIEEVESWFQKGVPAEAVLKERVRGCVLVYWRGGYYIGTGADVDKIRRTMFSEKKKDEVRDIRGLSASVGRVTGRVKVVGSVREIGKVQQGDILVSVMTRPDYIAGIKKAAAIVTNEGGITCHAAIVSRELGIPCIIGTKIATEVLKDGDTVEVNANHGVVTVLKRHN